jgi:hypothetical protein
LRRDDARADTLGDSHMKRTSRALAVVVTAATLITGSAVGTAVAKPDHTRQVVRDIERKEAQLDRAVRPNRVDRLSDTDAAAVLANVALDKADLDAILAAATAADSTSDLKQVRADLRSVRVENYRVVVNVLRHAAKAAAAAETAGDTESAALVAEAVATARTVRATSPKSLLRDARADLAAAKELLDTEDTEDTEDPVPAA